MTGECQEVGKSHPAMENGSDRTGRIIAQDVVVRYGQITALDHFSIDISRGIVGLLGPNGAGKSTFIKAVLGLVEPLSGQMTVSGLDSRGSMMAIRDRIGYMPEHDCLIDATTGIELVSYMGRLSGMSKSDAIPRSHEMLDFVGIGEERYRPIRTYSTGMKQRIKLAQAIVHDPDILFLDEPTNGMDPLGREEMLDLIARIAASEKTILVSSHILQDVEKVCRNVVIVTGGRAVAQGSIEHLLAKEVDRKKVQVRGAAERLKAFIEHLGQDHEIISVSEEFGQMMVVLVSKHGSGPLFELAKKEGVQVRSYLPDRMTLEDYFISAVKEAV